MKVLTYIALLSIAGSFSTSAFEVEKADWVNAMKTALPTAFCAPQQYFRQCFDVTPVQCEETAASATRVCLSNYQDSLPETFVQPNDGAHWGTIVGTCAGEAYIATLPEKYLESEKCDNPDNWR
ncbi:hypothetical protein [Enterovibrio calviensis]|uniref:hypothetical protein n=1 Tax=Enterovibrio calviensis TaxID=91359 RepID=UPI0004832F75|nr:hypothetical protein [Enterovibrio calviensis]